MITIRNLQSSDTIPTEYWPYPDYRPEPSTTLIAVRDGSIVGIIWMAYGGKIAMVVCWQSAIPEAVVPLWVAARKFARDKGCISLYSCIPSGRLLDTVVKRGAIVDETPLYGVVIPTSLRIKGGNVQCHPFSPTHR